MKIMVENLGYGFSKNHPVQRNLSFTWETGEVCCVLGPNGVGKTLLLKTILGQMEPLYGRVFIDNDDVRNWSVAKRAQMMAYVAQAHRAPFPYLVEDVVMLGRLGQKGYFRQPTKFDREIVDQAMIDLDVYDLRKEVYTDISGGELQLVMIARAIAQQPQFLVLDEPTAALDYGNAVRVILKARELAEKGYGVIMTTHSPDHAFLLNSRVLLLRKDAPMEFGSAIDVITERTMREAYGINVRIVEFAEKDGRIVRTCSPAIP